jgi:uncharacterized protein YndB with AHSA1/START domain
MTERPTPNSYGVLTEPATLTIQRLLPGPIERIWAYLTESDLRRKWLASGQMEMKVGTAFELTWRNDELTNPPGERPHGFSEEHSMQSRITALDPPRKLVFTWGSNSEVSINLAPKGNDVQLTLVHRRLPDDRATRLNIGTGWHSHLDILVACATGQETEPFWSRWKSLRKEYDQRISTSA